jgi:hypothetical protein
MGDVHQQYDRSSSVYMGRDSQDSPHGAIEDGWCFFEIHWSQVEARLNVYMLG